LYIFDDIYLTESLGFLNPPHRQAAKRCASVWQNVEKKRKNP